MPFASGDTANVKPGTYAIGETLKPGYTQTDLACVADGAELAVTDGSIEVQNGQDIVCTLTNADAAGSVSWMKAGPDKTTPLGGSEWTLTGPSGVTPVTVTDCVAGVPTDCTGPDQDPAAGAFSVENLTWGEYTLTESKAPAGYVLSDKTYSFTISGSSLIATVNDGAPIVNQKATSPEPPAASEPPVASEPPQTGAIGGDLPRTGADGELLLAIGGAALLLLGGGGYALSRKRSGLSL